MDAPSGSKTHLTWASVAIAFSFVAFDSVISLFYGLKVGGSLITAAIRCIIQLGLMALVLQSIFEANNPWAVAGITCLLNILGAFETVVNRSSRRYSHMFLSVLLAMFAATIPISLIATRFVMHVEPFWKPDQYIPIVGMLAGSTISGMVISISAVLREVEENRDKVETYLAFGASRLEACLPIVQHGLRIALLPPVNQMSVIGLISIPGMMTGALLGGSSVEQAAKLQMVIMFCICASTALGSMIAIVLCLAVVVDSDHRIRDDRIDHRQHIIWRACDRVGRAIVEGVARIWTRLRARSEEVEQQDIVPLYRVTRREDL